MLIKKTKYKYGWKKQQHDPRDLQYKDHHRLGAIQLPPNVDLDSKIPIKLDQGPLGSCSANAGVAAVMAEHGGGPYSRLQLYFGERLLEGTVNEDAGAELRDCIKVLANTGVALETSWPYDVQKFTVEPPASVLAEAAQNKISVYMALNGRDDYRHCLASGYPFIIGIQIFGELESDQVANTGILPNPTQNSEYMGGHAVTVIGYETNFHNHPTFKKSGLPESFISNDVYQIRNSWGSAWGDTGNFWISAEYLEDPNLASDAWTIRK